MMSLEASRSANAAAAMRAQGRAPFVLSLNDLEMDLAQLRAGQKPSVLRHLPHLPSPTHVEAQGWELALVLPLSAREFIDIIQAAVSLTAEVGQGFGWALVDGPYGHLGLGLAAFRRRARAVTHRVTGHTVQAL